jgi:hypothetical protein
VYQVDPFFFKYFFERSVTQAEHVGICKSFFGFKGIDKKTSVLTL